MKRYFLAVTFLLFSISGFAQKKKKQDTALPPPVPKAMEAPEFEIRETGNNQEDEEYPPVLTIMGTNLGATAISLSKTPTASVLI